MVKNFFLISNLNLLTLSLKPSPLVNNSTCPRKKPLSSSLVGPFSDVAARHRPTDIQRITPTPIFHGDKLAQHLQEGGLKGKISKIENCQVPFAAKMGLLHGSAHRLKFFDAGISKEVAPLADV